MAERKTIPKKIRFEVFKRDSFTCQYCGRHAPDVILECDHIVPVADGGKNTILNLVTACVDCNRGKGKTRLSDTTEVDKQFNEMSALNERRKQMEMLLKWKEELEQLSNQQIDVISDILCEDGWYLVDQARAKVKILINRFGFCEVLEAAEIAKNNYITLRGMSVRFAIEKMGGICYNRAKQKEAE